MTKTDIKEFMVIRGQLKRIISSKKLSKDQYEHWMDELRVIEYKLRDAGVSLRRKLK